MRNAAITSIYDTDDISPAEMLTEGVVLDRRDVVRESIIPRDRIAATAGSVPFEPDTFRVDTPRGERRQPRGDLFHLGNGVRIVKGVVNLGDVVPPGFDIVCTPLLYAGRDGSQGRLLVRPQ